MSNQDLSYISATFQLAATMSSRAWAYTRSPSTNWKTPTPHPMTRHPAPHSREGPHIFLYPHFQRPPRRLSNCPHGIGGAHDKLMETIYARPYRSNGINPVVPPSTKNHGSSSMIPSDITNILKPERRNTLYWWNWSRIAIRTIQYQCAPISHQSNYSGRIKWVVDIRLRSLKSIVCDDKASNVLLESPGSRSAGALSINIHCRTKPKMGDSL